MINRSEMEDTFIGNSPRKILSFSKNRKATILSADDKKAASSVAVSVDQGPKSSEVYGFVGSISTVVATVVYIVWAYVPEQWLHYIGISYYPSRYWALAVPTYAMVTIVLALVFYIGLNFIATPPPTSFNTIFDEYSREPVSMVLSDDDDEPPIEPISDIRIDRINELMFCD